MKKSILIIVAIALFGCNKNKGFNDLSFLIEKEWELVSIKQDTSIITESCDLDDILSFENTKTFTYNYGILECNSLGEIDKTPIKWQLINDFTQIKMKYKFKGNNTRGTLIEYWEIIELSDTLLILKDATAENNNLIPEIRTYNY